MNIKTNARQIITKHRSNLFSEGFYCSKIEEKKYNFETTASKNGQKLKLQIYFGKKGIKTVIQGNASSKEYNELNSLVTGKFDLQFSDEKDQQFDEYIGTDETGKGDYFGPLVIAGFYVDKNVQKFLSELGVRDSKELIDSQINKMADIIKAEYPKNYSVISINPEKYNDIYPKFNNVNKLLNWGHSMVIEHISETFKPETIIVDQFSKTPLKISLHQDFSNINFIQIPKAEKYIGVAAASIIARSEMNDWFEKKQRSGLNVLKGASFEVENAAKKIYLKNDRQLIRKLVKLHFKTTKKIFED